MNGRSIHIRKLLTLERSFLPLHFLRSSLPEGHGLLEYSSNEYLMKPIGLELLDIGPRLSSTVYQIVVQLRTKDQSILQLKNMTINQFSECWLRPLFHQLIIWSNTDVLNKKLRNRLKAINLSSSFEEEERKIFSKIQEFDKLRYRPQNPARQISAREVGTVYADPAFRSISRIFEEPGNIQPDGSEEFVSEEDYIRPSNEEDVVYYNAPEEMPTMTTGTISTGTNTEAMNWGQYVVNLQMEESSWVPVPEPSPVTPPPDISEVEVAQLDEYRHSVLERAINELPEDVRGIFRRTYQIGSSEIVANEHD